MTTIPAGAKAPTDHQKSAAQIEAEGIETIDIEWRDHTFTIAADAGKWKVTTTLAFEDGRAANGVKGVLGAKQWGALVKKSDPNNDDLNELLTLIASTLGLGTTGE